MVNDNKLLMIKLGWLKPTIDARLYSPEVRKDTQKLVNKCYRRANKKEAWIEERLRSVYQLAPIQLFWLEQGFVYARDYSVDGNMVLTDNDPDDWKGLIELLDRDYGGIERKEGRVISSQDELSYRLGDKNYRLVQSVGKDELDPTPFSLYVRFMMPDK